jgi:hypothetical protein
MSLKRSHRGLHIAAAALLAFVLPVGLVDAQQSGAQQPGGAPMIAAIDAIAQSRYQNVLSYSDVEVYKVFRGSDETHPAATLTARMDYRKGKGKTYTVLSQDGSDAIVRLGLKPLLENEQQINLPGNVEHSWFTTANYAMRFEPGVTRVIDGRTCDAIAVSPRRKAPHMVEGVLWVDSRDNSVAEIEGIASKRPSIFAGTTHMMRQYANKSGYAMATHARAESDSLLFGHTVVTIDYRDYSIQLQK